MLNVPQRIGTVAAASFLIIYALLQFPQASLAPVPIRLRQDLPYPAPPPNPTATPAYFAICTVVKDENSNLREWIHYHHWLGAGKIYIYDHNSSVPLLNDISDWVSAGIVNYERFAGFPSHNVSRVFNRTGQGYGFSTCLAKAKAAGHEWAAFLDADEFIVLYNNSHMDINRFLKKYEDYAALVVNWRVFGSSGYTHKPSEPALLAYTKCHLADTFNKQYKTIVHLPRNLGQVTLHNNPHMFRYGKGRYAVDESYKRVNQFFNFAPQFASIGLHHYVLRSSEEFEYKMKRGGGAGKRRNMAYWNIIEALSRGDCMQGVEVGKQWLNSTIVNSAGNSAAAS